MYMSGVGMHGPFRATDYMRIKRPVYSFSCRIALHLQSPTLGQADMCAGRSFSMSYRRLQQMHRFLMDGILLPDLYRLNETFATINWIQRNANGARCHQSAAQDRHLAVVEGEHAARRIE